MDMEMLTMQLKDLKSKNLILQEKIEELGNENAEKDLVIYFSWGDKKIWLALVMSWGFFSIVLLPQ
ncbi:(E)-2-epi-beta-caryophyllene synthase [Bienertia sinuspersici]